MNLRGELRREFHSVLNDVDIKEKYPSGSLDHDPKDVKDGWSGGDLSCRRLSLSLKKKGRLQLPLKSALVL